MDINHAAPGGNRTLQRPLASIFSAAFSTGWMQTSLYVLAGSNPTAAFRGSSASASALLPLKTKAKPLPLTKRRQASHLPLPGQSGKKMDWPCMCSGCWRAQVSHFLAVALPVP